MHLVTALIYWVIVSLWLTVLSVITLAYWRSPQKFGAVRLLLADVAIDTTRNVIENVYFGSFFALNTASCRDRSLVFSATREF